MILGDLLQATVTDASGAQLGHVIDVRFVVDGTPRQTLADARLMGLIVSPHSRASYWGYERAGQRGPAPIARYLRWRHRGTVLIPWTSVARIRSAPGTLGRPGRKEHAHVIELRPDHEAYDPAL
ncbi:PRC-barrel domain containing protein [Agromyces sp. MMS24-K17]|uniref:PRC-barrel domain containing protein n=1 Tax=Agromyces sp. MMS24-K17 TaxID=3372850 RepID=UPI00375505AB